MRAAIALGDQAGPAGLTMKAVASRLGAYTPMALYRYVYSKEGLIDLMLDEVSGEIPIPAHPSSDWRRDVHTVATETRRMIARHPWFASLIHTRPPAGPHMLRRLEFLLSVLTQHGASIADAMMYAALVDRHVIGSSMQERIETHSEPNPLDPREQPALLAGFAQMQKLAADGGCPLLSQWLAQPTGSTHEQQFELGLEFLLDGIAARLRANVRIS